jgi:peptidoglycan/xylan/chitin deacetylase (PgdA/CDA1 family)
VIAPACAAAAFAAAAWAVRGRSSPLFGPNLWHGNRARRVISLTFDDGPGESTPELLGILASHNVKATFFQCAANARRLPEIARRVSIEGHAIGNHTFSHPRLWLQTPGFIRREIALAQEILTQLHGQPPGLFRPPYGVRWFGLRRALREHGLTNVMWTAIGGDWRLPARQVKERLLRAACNGAILCLHDGRELQTRPDIGNTLRAVRELLPELKDQGFKFVTLGPGA